jgi:hypothetical protein
VFESKKPVFESKKPVLMAKISEKLGKSLEKFINFGNCSIPNFPKITIK